MWGELCRRHDPLQLSSLTKSQVNDDVVRAKFGRDIALGIGKVGEGDALAKIALINA
jgi:hypothetical protein